MSAASVLGLRPDPPSPLRLLPAEKVWFTYECKAGLFNPRIFLCSVLCHAAALIFLPTMMPRVEILPVAADLTQQPEITLIYTPTLPEIKTSAEPSRAAEKGTAGTQQRSAAERIRTIANDRDSVPVFVQSLVTKARDLPKLASVLPLSEHAQITLAPQPIEIMADRMRDDFPPALVMPQVKSKIANVPNTPIRVELGPQPIEIAADSEALTKQSAPEMIPISALSVTAPKLPVVSGTTKVRKAAFISGGRRSFEATGDASAATSFSAGSVSGMGGPQAIPSGVLGGSGTNVILDPTRGNAIATASAQPGRIAAAPDGVSSGRGLGLAGGGRSDTGTRGIGSNAAGAGPAGPGSTGSGTQAGAAGNGRTPSDVMIDGGVLNLGSFGPAATGPLHGRRPAVVVVSSAAAGGPLQQFASHLKGQIYTVYLNAAGTTAVMEFAQAKSAPQEVFASDLVSPEAIATSLPKELRGGHQVISCILTTEGKLRNVKVLEAATDETALALTKALADWQFRPAYRGDSPVEVNVLLGFGVDTN